MNAHGELIDILLVEDNPGDVRLTREALKEAKFRNQLHVVCDGVEAVDYLHRRGEAEVDILKAYDLHANCYISKPLEIDQFLTVVKAIEDFWLTIVKIPPRGD
jgi:two-component system, chemotaxis family, response regulator Rcp1